MGARQKLNQAYLTGVVLFATLLGATTGSWFVFMVTLFVGGGLSLHNGDIRPSKGPRKMFSRPRQH